MFSEVERVLKIISIIVLFAGIGISIVSGIVYSSLEVGTAGVIVAFVGSILSVTLSAFIQGFSEIVEHIKYLGVEVHRTPPPPPPSAQNLHSYQNQQYYQNQQNYTNRR